MNSTDEDDFKGTARFAVVRRVGAGGMGVVYEALDRERDARVALKTLRRLDATALYRFKQEFHSLAELVHPNLVPLYEFISDGSRWFFTMELVDGVDFLSYVRPPTPHPMSRTAGAGKRRAETTERLADPRPTESAAGRPAEGEGLPGETVDQTAVASTAPDPTVYQPAKAPEAGATVTCDHRPAPPDVPPADEGQNREPAGSLDFGRLREAFRQLAEGVRALHVAGKLHCDLKPGNVLVRTDGRVVLLDFGLVAEPGSAPVDGHVAGTVAYMAPEQAAARPLTPASDWYAVGVMLFRALTGRLPITGTPFQVLRDKQRVDPPAPADLVRGVPADLRELRRRAFTAMRELLARLGARRPLVLCIDDLQWGDVDSAALLADLLRPPAAPRLLLLIAYRSEYVATSACLQALTAAEGVPGAAQERGRLAVDALTPEETRALARALLGEDGPDARSRADWVVRESGGSAFLIYELVRHLKAGMTRAAAKGVGLDEVLWRRVRRLPEEARRLLEVVAVAGQPVRLRQAQEAAGVGSLPPQVVLALRGQTRERASWGDADFDEGQHLARLAGYGSRHFAHFSHIARMQTLYLWGEYERALEAARVSRRYLKESPGMLHSAEHHFYEALTLAALYPTRGALRRWAWRRALRRAQARLRKWAGQCPGNFLAKERLVAAEVCRLRGRDAEAVACYAAAVAAAERYGYLQVQALAHELAARFHLARANDEKAASSLTAARDAYRRWGAAAYADALPARLGRVQA